MTRLKNRPSSLFTLLGWSSNSSHLPDKSVHVARNSREDQDVLEFYEMVMVDPVFHHHQFVWMSRPYVLVVLLYSGLYRWPSLSDIHLATLAGYAVYSWSPKSKVILHWTEEAGDLTRQQANSFDVVLGQHSAEPAVCCLDIL